MTTTQPRLMTGAEAERLYRLARRVFTARPPKQAESWRTRWVTFADQLAATGVTRSNIHSVWAHAQEVNAA